MPNSFGSLATFQVDDRTYPLLPPRRPRRPGGRPRPPAVLAQDPPGEPAPQRGRRRPSPATTSSAWPSWDPKAIPNLEIAFRPSRVLLQDFTGVPAVVDLAAMRDAMKRMGGDPKKINPLQPVELVIDHSVQVDEAGTRQRLRDQRRAGILPEPRAVRLPPLGPGRLPELPGRPARHRDRPPGEPRIPRPGRLQLDRRRGRRRRRRAAGLSRHPGRDRLAHHDDQRPGRPGLGRRRDRGRGGDARPAGLDAGPAGRRLQAPRLAPRGGDGDRPGPDRHRACSAARAWSASSSSSTATAWPPSRWPTGRRSPTWPPSTGRPAGSSRSTPRRSATSNSRAGPTDLIRLVEAYARAQGLFHAAGDARGDVLRHPGTRPRDRRAQPGRPEAAPGPGHARARPRSRSSKALKVMHEAKPALAPRPNGAAASADDRRQERDCGSKARAAAGPPSAPRTRRPPRPPTGRSATATSSTARSSSPRSPAAPTPRTPRS